MNKYYTPELEEFHVGFEYEVQTWKDKWETETLIDLNSQDSDGALYPWIPTEQSLSCFRVKYLDKEDIKSLGWKEQESNSVYFTKDNYILVHWITSDGRDINIFEKYDGGTQEECLIRKAKVKNKSELKKLLKQLKIIE